MRSTQTIVTCDGCQKTVEEYYNVYVTQNGETEYLDLDFCENCFRLLWPSV